MSGARRACDGCLRRTHLVTLMAGRIERERHRRRLPELLALDNDALVAAVAGRDATMVRRALDAFVPAAARGACEAAGLVALCLCDARYPARLLVAPDAPAVLHIAGDPAGLEALAGEMDDAPAVAIVGARRSTAYGDEVARALGRGLAAAGVPVVSGMAFGIDAAAQAGALEAGGPTIAVLAGGADVPYPASKRGLYERIISPHGRGCVVSELPPGFRPFRWCFPARNRIIAGLAGLTVVVEAAQRSGSLITAELAAGLGRTVGAVPGRVTTPQAAGANALLADGAALVRDACEALDLLLGPGAHQRRPSPSPGDGLEPRLRIVLEAVAAGRDMAGTVADHPADVHAAGLALTELELMGHLRRDHAGRYTVVPQ
ncbi:MAG TPA: DNA-processing protein DprA [Solirubrobacteraceae bacterium]|nr:DNA-processing protein DprA [Solirubrobacteraceae bacterium]